MHACLPLVGANRLVVAASRFGDSQQIFSALVLVIFLLNSFRKVLQKRLLPRSGFGAAISVSIARHSMVLCNSVSADRFALAASRFLAAAVACVILVSCAAESRES